MTGYLFIMFHNQQIPASMPTTKTPSHILCITLLIVFTVSHIYLTLSRSIYDVGICVGRSTARTNAVPTQRRLYSVHLYTLHIKGA